MIENIARLAVLVDLPRCSIGQRIFRLDIKGAVSRQMSSQQRQQFVQPALVIRRIDKDEIETLPVLRQKTQRILVEYLCALRLQFLLIVAQRMISGDLFFHHDEGGCAARHGFEAHGTGTGEQVETGETVHVLPKPVEHGLTYPIRGRAQARRIGETQQARAPFAAADTYLVGRLSGRLIPALRRQLPSPFGQDGCAD